MMYITLSRRFMYYLDYKNLYFYTFFFFELFESGECYDTSVRRCLSHIPVCVCANPQLMQIPDALNVSLLARWQPQRYVP